jgi:Uncharacterized protein conserved in bacteria|tara:strand:- start:1651 stop:2064 length:414 start_codon:yes stop_codon:yes gene_type:complete
LSNKISDKDKKDWENFLSKRENLFDKDSKSLSKKINKEITFDLHGYSLDEANKEIYQLIKNSYDRGISKLVIVTGKGIHSQNEKDPYISKDFGILKNSVPEYIRNNSDIMRMINNLSEANIEDGGSGAFYIYLKKKL